MSFKPLFGKQISLEIQRLILDFEPTKREMWDNVMDELTGLDRFDSYFFDRDVQAITNYPNGYFDDYLGNASTTQWTYRYYNTCLNRMVPTHRVDRQSDGMIVIEHYMNGSVVGGRSEGDPEILFPIY